MREQQLIPIILKQLIIVNTENMQEISAESLSSSLDPAKPMRFESKPTL